MKNIFLGLMMVICGVGCTSFNRDALWNAPIDEKSYCTYYKDDFQPGSLFVHRQDDWTDKRLSYGYELKVIDIVDNWVMLDHGWSSISPRYNSFDFKNDPKSPYTTLNTMFWMRTSPIFVKVLHPENVKIGELFKEYGQYMYLYDDFITVSNKEYFAKHLEQINESQELVAKPFPFIYIRPANN